MAYRLRDGLSYCEVDDSLIFLDLDEDRYFSLPPRLEQRLRSHLQDDKTGATASDLVHRKILIDTPESADNFSPPRHPATLFSALEHHHFKVRTNALVLAEVLATICSTRLQLKWCRLRNVIDELCAYRQQRVARVSSDPSEPSSELLLEATQAFRHARRQLPIEPSCLLDSISLIRFLSRRRLHARLVFGVTHHPFAAHCWVQAGDWVLNDTVGSITTHTPIREI